MKLKIPAKPEYVAVARLAVGGLARLYGFDADEIDDIKVAVSEACTKIIFDSKRRGLEDGLLIKAGLTAKYIVIDVSHSGLAIDETQTAFEDDLSHSILKGLVDKVELIPGSQDFILRLTKSRTQRSPLDS